MSNSGVATRIRASTPPRISDFPHIAVKFLLTPDNSGFGYHLKIIMVFPHSSFGCPASFESCRNNGRMPCLHRMATWSLDDSAVIEVFLFLVTAAGRCGIRAKVWIFVTSIWNLWGLKLQGISSNHLSFASLKQVSAQG